MRSARTRGTYDGVEDLWKQVQPIARPLDIAVLNAGVSIGGAFATDTGLEEEPNPIALNINAIVHLAKRVVPGTPARGRGRILITSSIPRHHTHPLRDRPRALEGVRLLLRRVPARRAPRQRSHRHRAAAGRHRQRLPRPRRHGTDRHRQRPEERQEARCRAGRRRPRRREGPRRRR
ncbi:SDR family NAD(P)-dependent oxidoreductase [Streptomyces sp. NPDC059092]|uniref:SDR family NAD(P)-dependent oxidoreductase n=1 Tax=Streptomyces sp. NPDC059092 TaxID=3346725 RepID=UPI0036A0C068